MLAKIAEHVPQTGDFLFEPKWDGFRAIVFRSADDVYIQSRDLKPLDRYFPELHAVFLAQLPKGVVVDGEIVMPTKHGLDFGPSPYASNSLTTLPPSTISIGRLPGAMSSLSATIPSW